MIGLVELANNLDTICVNTIVYDAHTNPIFMDLKILRFENIVKLRIGKVMYLYKNGLLPDSFNDSSLWRSLIKH